MSLKIKTSADPVFIGGFVTLIYGQPGIGKTSLGFSAKSPLLFDFENGAYRSAYRKDYVQIDEWEEVVSVTDSDLKGYRTVVIDTLGGCIDSITRHLINSNPKMMNRTTGGLSLPGFGSLKMAFTSFVHRLHIMGLDVVLLAHAKEKSKDDQTIIRPDIVGSSYDEMMKISTLVGYYSIVNENGKNLRVLNFNPTESWIGKNSAGFEPLNVPSLSNEPEYLSDLLDKARKNMGDESEQMAKEKNLVDYWRDLISGAKNADNLNRFILKINDEIKNPGTKRRVKSILVKKAKDLNIKWNGEQYKFGDEQ